MKIWRVLVGGFAAIGALATLVVIAGIIVIFRLTGESAPPSVPPETIVLRLDLRAGLADRQPADSFFAHFDGDGVTLREAVEAIDLASSDPRVAGLVGHFDGEAFGMATAQELAAAIGRFRESGKFTIAYADTMGEAGPSNIAYYLASAFEEIWILPLGTVGLTGLRAELPFAREALNEFGIDPQFTRRGEYKSFPEMFTERDFTPANREMTEALIGDMFDQMVTGIAVRRGLAEGAVRGLVDGAPFTATEAMELGLVDRLANRRDIHEEIESRAGEASGTMMATEYLAVAQPDETEDRTTIALVYATGAVSLGRDGDSALSGRVMGADTVAGAINEAIDDPVISAIVLRINSPGGSPVASEIIGGAVDRAADEGKPLIVSMGEVAASGGYWIAAGAQQIVAQPATITGSIGVLSGKFDTSEFWDDLGVNWSGVQRGRNADMWSGTSGFSQIGAERLNAMVDEIYAKFLDRVSAGRGMERDAVDAVARGRVWTGTQAQTRGLVDHLGGLDVAFDIAREAAGADPDAGIDLVILPQVPSPIEQLLSLAAGGGLQSGQRIDAAVERLEPYLRSIAPLLEEPGTQMLRMPELIIR